MRKAPVFGVVLGFAILVLLISALFLYDLSAKNEARKVRAAIAKLPEFMSVTHFDGDLLTKLTFDRKEMIERYEVPSEAVKGVRKRTFDDEGMAYVIALISLRSLNLSRTNVTDIGISHLSKLPSLQDLSIVGTKISSEGLAHLKSLEALESLTLDLDLMSDVGVSYVREIRGLKKLIVVSPGLIDPQKIDMLQRRLDRIRVIPVSEGE